MFNCLLSEVCKMKNMLFFLIFVISGCASTNSVQLEPKAVNKQQIAYERGGAKFHSQAASKFELTILDYSQNEMVVGVSVTNSTSEPISYSEKNVTVEWVYKDEVKNAHIYNFEELAEEAGEKGYRTGKLVASTAAGIGASFIPFGGIAYSVGSLFYAIGSQDSKGGHQQRIDKLVYSQLNKNYLRRQTIAPGETYSGILKIGFEDALEAENIIIIQVAVGDEVEKFHFTCKEIKEK